MVEHVSDFKMPEKIVARLLKDALPEDVLISREAKNVACRSASVFILHLSIIAADKASANRRRTLDTRDIIDAASDLGLGEYAPQLVRFGAQRKRNAKRKASSIQKSRSKGSASHSEHQNLGTIEANGVDFSATISDNQDEDAMLADQDPSIEQEQDMEDSTSAKGEPDQG